MKNYIEVTNDLLERRNHYIAEQKDKRKRIMGIVATACCVCLIALMGFGMRQDRWPLIEPEQTSTVAPYPSIRDALDASKGETPDDLQTNNQIYILQVEEFPTTTRALFALMVDDFISMNRDEINEYYGVNIFPSVPSDLQEDDGEALGIYKRENGTGEVYWDSNGINYFNEDYSRCVYVGVDKDCIPFDFCNLFDGVQSKSVICNIEVGIAQTANGDYYAEFMHMDVGFRVVASGLTQDELISIISSLLA